MLGVAGGFEKLNELVRTEKDPELKRSAIRSLGMMPTERTGDFLKTIYTSDSNLDVRREIINLIGAHNGVTTLVELARAEKDPTLKREIVQRLSSMKSKEATDYLLELLK